MRRPVLAATLLLPVLGAWRLAGSAPPAATEAPTAAGRAAEVRRIRAHFDSVLAELPRRDPAGLAPAQRARRRALLDTLRAYRDRGDFPHNYDFPGRAVPYFVDRGTGTLCAVAYLLAASGRRDVVDRVARADNNVWVPALAADTAFTGWLDASGLTLAEAARIQLPYMMDVQPEAPARARAGASAPAASLGAAAAAAALWNARGNARGASRAGTVLGMAAGAAAVGVGAATAGQAGGRPVLGAATAAVGAASVWLGARGLRRNRADLRAAAVAQREHEAARRASVTPLLPLLPGTGVGAQVAVRF